MWAQKGLGGAKRTDLLLTSGRGLIVVTVLYYRLETAIAIVL